MKKVRMSISHFRFILFNLKIFDEIVTTQEKWTLLYLYLGYTYTESLNFIILTWTLL